MYSVKEEVNSKRNIIEYYKTISDTCYLRNIQKIEILLSIVFPNKSNSTELDENEWRRLLKIRRTKHYE